MVSYHLLLYTAVKLMPLCLYVFLSVSLPVGLPVILKVYCFVSIKQSYMMVVGFIRLTVYGSARPSYVWSVDLQTSVVWSVDLTV